MTYIKSMLKARMRKRKLEAVNVREAEAVKALRFRFGLHIEC